MQYVKYYNLIVYSYIGIIRKWFYYSLINNKSSIEISTLYFMNIIVIILSILLFIYSTFVYNKLNKEVCSYTQLSIPSFDLENILYLIPKITFVIISLFLYANNTNYLIVFILSSIILYGIYYSAYDNQNSIKCAISNIGGTYLYLILISIITFLKVKY